MREIKIKGKTYILKYTHRAARCQDCVQKAFELLSGKVIMGCVADADNPSFSDYMTGLSKQVGLIPQLCDTFMYAGLKAENPVDTEEEAQDLLCDYLDETGKSYNDVFESFKECMEEDGFFELSGIVKMIEDMDKTMMEAIPKEEDAEEVEKVQEKPQAKAKPKTTAKVTPIKK